MNPLIQVKSAFEQNILPQKIFEQISSRFNLVIDGINRIESSSGVQFPTAYVDPSIVVTNSGGNSFDYGILFARTLPVQLDDSFRVVIQISAPLVAYGLKGTIHAILAHEFLHYLELVRKVSTMDLLSDEMTSNLFENVYSDSEKLFEPRAVFNDKTLLLHITKKFPSGFRDFKLEDKTIKFWIDQNLPISKISLDRNAVKLSTESLSKIHFDPKLLSKINDFELKSKRIRKKQLY